MKMRKEKENWRKQKLKKIIYIRVCVKLKETTEKKKCEKLDVESLEDKRRKVMERK